MVGLTSLHIKGNKVPPPVYDTAQTVRKRPLLSIYYPLTNLVEAVTMNFTRNMVKSTMLINKKVNRTQCVDFLVKNGLDCI